MRSSYKTRGLLRMGRSATHWSVLERSLPFLPFATGFSTSANLRVDILGRELPFAVAGLPILLSDWSLSSG